MVKGLDTDAMGRVNPKGFISWCESTLRKQGIRKLFALLTHLENQIEPINDELFAMLPEEALTLELNLIITLTLTLTRTLTLTLILI